MSEPVKPAPPDAELVRIAERICIRAGEVFVHLRDTVFPGIERPMELEMSISLLQRATVIAQLEYARDVGPGPPPRRDLCGRPIAGSACALPAGHMWHSDQTECQP